MTARSPLRPPLHDFCSRREAPMRPADGQTAAIDDDKERSSSFAAVIVRRCPSRSLFADNTCHRVASLALRPLAQPSAGRDKRLLWQSELRPADCGAQRGPATLPELEVRLSHPPEERARAARS